MRPALLFSIALSMTLPAHAAAPELSTLAVGADTSGFRVASIYLDAFDKPMGARFKHTRTGFTLDLMQIESVPQAFTWVNTFAVGDQGEPHTQEHLLLLRGVRGRTLQAKDSMSLVTSSAFTQTWRTSYFFHTTAGVDVFFDVFAEQQRAMLHPNYTDAEIRLEVRNFGVTKNPDGSLRLEEKGTVYNEMVSSMANAGWKEWRAQNHVVYGEKHALGYNQGGEPSGIRTMTPEDIRRFHKATHHLGNMGSIAAFPKRMPLGEVLARFDKILSADAPKGKPRPADTLEQLPPPAGDPPGAIRMYDYPHQNAQQPSPFSLVWPASRKLDAAEQLLADLFFDNLAGDATTNLYKLFVDGRTRKSDLNVRSVGAEVQPYGGHPIRISFSDATPARMTDEGLKGARTLVMAEIDRIAALQDGSAELREFNDRLANRVIERERALAKFIGTPPGFGARGGDSAWMDHLLLLEKTPQTRKSLTMKPEIAFVRERLASGRNIWREYLAKWNVTGVTPYIAGARPNTGLVEQEAKERDARLAEETERLRARHGGDVQAALARYSGEIDKELGEIEAASKVPPMAFLKSPPMTLDDDLRFEARRLPNGVPIIASRFDNMTGVMAGIALKVDGVPRDELRYLSLLPNLMSSVGVIENGKPVAYEAMRERLRREVLTLNAGFSSNVRTGRVELTVRGAGIGLEESGRALNWMQLVMHSPDWRPENLPRIRDVVDQALAAHRNTTQSPEEYWVNDPANAYRMQRHPAWLATSSFLTRTYNALRLRWQLKDAGPDADAVGAFLSRLVDSSGNLQRPQLSALLAKTPALEGPQLALAQEALRDLQLALDDIPDTSLQADFAYLANAMRDDLLAPPSEALARLDTLRKRLLRTGAARMFVAGPQEMTTILTPRIESLAARLETASAPAIWHGGDGLIDARLQQREPDAQPMHVGLFAPNKQGGVIMTSVPSAQYSDFSDRELQLDFLTARLHGGAAPHSAFSKTVGAGLAYSNGIRGTVSSGRVGYYAERTPELPQTVRFVVDLIKETKPNPWYAEYVMALAFQESRAAGTYEARAEAIAADLADGQTPEQVRRFRRSLLELRKDRNLARKMFERRDRVHGAIVPGFDPHARPVPGTISFAIGPDKQLDAWNEYLRSAAGGARLYKLYPRDFWM
ncbi:MAG TPA: hypothetical protein VM073_01560 [Usitatibacter sp.]|nr:hypothetical protein [Usitatibacter sp.]